MNTVRRKAWGPGESPCDFCCGVSLVSAGEEQRTLGRLTCMKERALSILILIKALLLPAMGTLISIIRTLPHHQFFTTESVRAWRAAFFLCAHLLFWGQRPFGGESLGIVCAGSGPAFPFSPCSHPLASDLHHLIPSSWLGCCNQWELFLNAVQRCV